jgi:hypothetical protein
MSLINQNLETETRFNKLRKYIEVWLIDNLDNFSPLNVLNKDEENFCFKALSELSLYLFLSEPNPNKQLRSSLFEIVTSSKFIGLLLQRPLDTVAGITCILPFRTFKGFEKIGRYYKYQCQPFINEALPFETLGHAFTLEVLGLYDEFSANMESHAIALSSIVNPPNGCSAQKLGAYTFTHSVFYATRFGSRKLSIPNVKKIDIKNSIDIEICKAYNKHNIDIALELVLSRFCLFGELNSTDSVILTDAINLIETTGFLVAPPHEGENLYDENSSQRKWVERYHPMLVFGILICKLIERFDKNTSFTASFSLNHTNEFQRQSMDAIGAIYNSLERGNLPLSVVLYSKLDFQHDDNKFKNLMRHYENYFESISDIFSTENADCKESEGLGAWSISTSTFKKLKLLFGQTQAK